MISPSAVDPAGSPEEEIVREQRAQGLGGTKAPHGGSGDEPPSLKRPSRTKEMPKGDKL